MRGQARFRLLFLCAAAHSQTEISGVGKRGKSRPNGGNAQPETAAQSHLGIAIVPTSATPVHTSSAPSARAPRHAIVI